MRSLKRQRGLSPLGWIALLIVVGFAAIVAIRIVPVYMDYYAVVNSAKSVHTQGALDGSNEQELRRALDKQLSINNVDDIGDDIVTIKRSSGGIQMTVDYEVREHLIGNIDVVMKFHRRIGS